MSNSLGIAQKYTTTDRIQDASSKIALAVSTPMIVKAIGPIALGLGASGIGAPLAVAILLISTKFATDLKRYEELTNLMKIIKKVLTRCLVMFEYNKKILVEYDESMKRMNEKEDSNINAYLSVRGIYESNYNQSIKFLKKESEKKKETNKYTHNQFIKDMFDFIDRYTKTNDALTDKNSLLKSNFAKKIDDNQTDLNAIFDEKKWDIKRTAEDDKIIRAFYKGNMVYYKPIETDDWKQGTIERVKLGEKVIEKQGGSIAAARARAYEAAKDTGKAITATYTAAKAAKDKLKKGIEETVSYAKDKARDEWNKRLYGTYCEIKNVKDRFYLRNNKTYPSKIRIVEGYDNIFKHKNELYNINDKILEQLNEISIQTFYNMLSKITDGAIIKDEEKYMHWPLIYKNDETIKDIKTLLEEFNTRVLVIQKYVSGTSLKAFDSSSLKHRNELIKFITVINSHFITLNNRVEKYSDYMKTFLHVDEQTRIQDIIKTDDLFKLLIEDRGDVNKILEDYKNDPQKQVEMQKAEGIAEGIAHTHSSTNNEQQSSVGGGFTKKRRRRNRKSKRRNDLKRIKLTNTRKNTRFNSRKTISYRRLG